MNKEHGSPWDRGTADSYYCRATRPHYVKADGTHVGREEMTSKEVEEYYAGYDYNERYGDTKDAR